MPPFLVDCETEFTPTLDERKRLIWKLELNDEWAILCDVSGCSSWDPERINSVEIHRKNITGEHSVTGVLAITRTTHRLWGKKFSQFITTGSSFIKISSVSDYFLYSDHTYWLHGVVNISDNSEKCATAPAKGESKKGNQLKSLEELSNHLERLLDPNSSCFADVTIKCGSTSIPAHKNILSARSPVFAAMFSNPMKESHKNEVDVTDVDVSVLRALLIYMYTGKCNELSAAIVADLLFAADKYQLQDLKRVCCDFLKETVSLQNVLRILVLGELHAQDLKSFAVDYICNKCTEFPVLEKSEEWGTLRKERPNLAIDVLTSLVNSRIKIEKLNTLEKIL